MAVAEKLRSLLKRNRRDTPFIVEEALDEMPEVVDVLNGNYSFHWTELGQLSSILLKGIYSLEFALRINDEQYLETYLDKNKYHKKSFAQVWSEFDRYVHLSAEPEIHAMPTRVPNHDLIGIVIDRKPIAAEHIC